jgi:hypothetical protein
MKNFILISLLVIGQQAFCQESEIDLMIRERLIQVKLTMTPLDSIVALFPDANIERFTYESRTDNSRKRLKGMSVTVHLHDGISFNFVNTGPPQRWKKQLRKQEFLLTSFTISSDSILLQNGLKIGMTKEATSEILQSEGHIIQNPTNCPLIMYFDLNWEICFEQIEGKFYSKQIKKSVL